ncbi:MAG: alcohol dehydrogenase catalytic domain-containing protein, partial [Candidatus Halalkalibacterium sp. M3_1C_030]
MKAMVLEKQGEELKLKNIKKPEPDPSQIQLKVSHCGICRTDLHILDGDLDKPKLPLVPGHQIVGTVQKL